MPEEKTPPEPAHHPGTPKGEERAKKEGKEPGRRTTGTRGAKRPAGKSSAETSTGVNPKDPVDPQSPNLPTP